MSEGYGQYCPLALSAELLCRRWMILVVSRLIDGCRRFNDIQRGLPQISPTLLSKRLSELVDAGVATYQAPANGHGGEYLLTQAGRELEPVIDRMAIWGLQWARDMRYEDLDPAFLVWSMHLRSDPSKLPPGRTVLEFEFDDSPTSCRRFWLVCRDGEVEMCLKDPGSRPTWPSMPICSPSSRPGADSVICGPRSSGGRSRSTDRASWRPQSPSFCWAARWRLIRAATRGANSGSLIAPAGERLCGRRREPPHEHSRGD